MARPRHPDVATVTLNLRDVPLATAQRFKRAARVRDLPLVECLTHLLDAHDAARAHADAGDDALQAELLACGMATVRG